VSAGIGLVALAVGTAFVLFVWLAGRPTLQVVNVDGPSVDIVPWVDGPSIVVPCGHTATIDTTGAPGQPWVLTVTSEGTHRVLLHEGRSGSLEVIVRQGGGVLIVAANPPSVGPAGSRCLGSP
jgi:hypothetical protein